MGTSKEVLSPSQFLPRYQLNISISYIPPSTTYKRTFHQNNISKMPSNIAIVVQKPGEAKAVEASIPKLRDDYILVRTKAVALNPTDWKHIEWLTSNGARVSQYNSYTLTKPC